MKRRRVKITGIGPVTPAGIGRDEFWKGILESVSRIALYNEIRSDKDNVTVGIIAASVRGFRNEDYVDISKVPKGIARQSLFAVVASMLALKDAGIACNDLKSENCAIVTGSSLLDFGGIGAAIDAVANLGVRAARARVVYSASGTSVANAINGAIGMSARALAIQSSCCSGLDAIGHASRLVENGEVEFALCGGTEAPLYKFPLLELRAAGLTPSSTELPHCAARPFDLWRTSGVVSEGACMFVLEPENSPREAICWVGGYSNANDQDGDLCGGLVNSGRMAIAEANIRPEDVDSISAWGPGHKLIDMAEAKAMHKLFPKTLTSIPAVSIKGALGSALGAAPAIQVAAAALGLSEGIVPPTVNWEYPDPECPLNLSNSARVIAHDFSLVNAHSVGSANSSLILSRC
jgi:3-oxoacyl-(acyl-carrier-protein) synthase